MVNGIMSGTSPSPSSLHQKHDVLAHQASAEVAKILFPLGGKGEWVSGGLVDREKEQGDHRMDYHIQRRQRSSLYRVRTEGGFLSHIQIGRDNSNECKLDLFPLSWKNGEGPRDNSLIKCSPPFILSVRQAGCAQSLEKKTLVFVFFSWSHFREH